MIIVHPLCLIVHLWHLNAGTHLLGRLLVIIMARDLYKFLHQGGISTCQVCHTIQSNWCKGKGSGSLDIEVCEGSRMFPTSAPAGDGSSLTRSSWRWGFSDGGHSRSSSPSTRTVPASSLGLDQLASLWGASSVCTHWQGQPVGLIKPGIMFQALFC